MSTVLETIADIIESQPVLGHWPHMRAEADVKYLRGVSRILEGYLTKPNQPTLETPPHAMTDSIDVPWSGQETEVCTCRDVLVMDGVCTQCKRPIRYTPKTNGKPDV